MLLLQGIFFKGSIWEKKKKEKMLKIIDRNVPLKTLGQQDIANIHHISCLINQNLSQALYLLSMVDRPNQFN